MSNGPTGIVALIIELLKAHPEGLTEAEMRDGLGLAGNEQIQMGRRRREVRKWYELIKVPNGNSPRYTLGEKREQPTGPPALNGSVKAEILHMSRGRCQMCGRTVYEDGVKLQVDHKIPQAWGGTNDIDNLWALCTECNHGKKDLFASQDDTVKNVLRHKSIHVRIGELLKQHFGSPVPSRLIEFVANQDDWKKRTRELRYLGWDIVVTKQKQANGRVRSFYQLNKFTEWPENPTAWIRKFEKDREDANKSAKEVGED